MNTYEIDTTVQLAATFTTIDGTAVDPVDVNLYLLDPNGAETTLPIGALNHESLGVWTYQFKATVSGAWVYKFGCSGTITVTSPDTTFLVNPSVLISG